MPTTIKLFDISCDGYQSNTYILENQGELYSADLYFYRLNDVGVAQMSVAQYYWYDYNNGDDQDPDWEGGRWMENVSGKTITKDDDAIFDYASGFWFYNGLTLDDGEQITIQNCGAVCPDDYTYPLAPKGNVIGNAMPTTIKLFDISCDGYQSNTYILENQGELYSADLYFYRLNDVGVAQMSVAQYYWYDYNNGDDQDPDWEGGRWMENVSGKTITKDSPDCIEPGDAVWFYNGLTLDPGEQITITFPSPIADHEEVKE